MKAGPPDDTHPGIQALLNFWRRISTSPKNSSSTRFAAGVLSNVIHLAAMFKAAATQFVMVGREYVFRDGRLLMSPDQTEIRPLQDCDRTDFVANKVSKYA